MKFLLFSDIHYTVEQSAKKFNKFHPSSKASVASGKILGFTQEEKINQARADILNEHSKSALDAVFMLGDLSIDDYDYRNLPLNYCQELKLKLFDTLPCPVYAIAGNHDSYPDEIWKNIFGYSRQYSVEIGKYVFIMADTFNFCPAEGASGSKYTSVDIDFVKKVMDEHPNSKFFICAHYIRNNGDSEELLRLIEDDRVICLFRGHTHEHGTVKLPCRKSIIDIGGYGYFGFKADYGYEFNVFDEKCAWGYELIETSGDEIKVSHITTARKYDAKNGCFFVSEKAEQKKI